jgi:hypothetical protein
MNIIDAIEGSARYIIDILRLRLNDGELDDTEYIKNVQTVIDAQTRFVSDNNEIACDPKVLKEILYIYSKELWLEVIERRNISAPIGEQGETINNREYLQYYYDYIYTHGVYPP